MSVLGISQVARIFDDGTADRVALYALRKVTTGDTVDMATDFMVVKQAAVVGTTVMDVLTCAITGTVVTMPAGLSSDAGYMLAWGASSGSA